METQEVMETEARLMISKIVCENFKSYAGTRELGPFHKVIANYSFTHNLLYCKMVWWVEFNQLLD